MVTGFNHDVRHRGRVFHVQTEDSGPDAAQLTTHLFLDGAVLASARSSYAELRGAADLAAQVRRLMEEQHKALLRRLVAGEFDEAAGGR